MNYFVFNKELDYRRGYGEGVVWDADRLVLEEGRREGVFFSRVFDSQEAQTRWQRFVMDAEGRGTASILFTFYASDSLELAVSGRMARIPELICDPDCPAAEKKRLLEPLKCREALFPRDILLHEAKGRYLFFTAELFSQGGQPPSISKMVLYFPREDWLAFLPGVYRKKEAGADFTSRFLSVFQSFYDDMDERIRKSSRLLNVRDTSMECLLQIAGWFHIRDVYLWPEDRLRRLLAEASGLYPRAGTAQGMLDMIRLYTGETPFLIECGLLPETDPLYSGNPFECILLVREQYMSTVKEREALACLAEQMKPAHMEVRLAALKPRIALGGYCYLGINSEIGRYQPARLDGRFSLAFSAVGTLQGGDEE